MSAATPPAATGAGPSAAWRSIAWQAFGSTATLGAALWVSWRLGLAAQGEFGLAKSWFDAAAAIASLGLPQGLLHLQYRLKVAASALLPWVMRAMLVLGAAAIIFAVASLVLGQRLAALAALSAPFAVGHLLARSLLLARGRVVAFGFVTALPAFLVLAGVVAFGWLQWVQGFDAMLLAAVIAASAVSLTWARRASGTPIETVLPRGELWRVSLQNWLQTAFAASISAGVLSVVAAADRPAAELGAAALGLQIYQGLVALVGYVMPMLFDRLARQETPVAPQWASGAVFGSVGMLLIALVTAIASFFEPRWAPWALPLAMMIPAGVAAVFARISATVLLARGKYSELSLEAVCRLVAALLVSAIALHWLSGAGAAAFALLVVEGLTLWRNSRLALKSNEVSLGAAAATDNGFESERRH